MRNEVMLAESHTRQPRPLVVRAGLFRTFGSLAGFLALVLLTIGIYLIEDTFTNPLTAQPAALVAGGFILGLDGVLFYFLIKPRRATRPLRVRYRRRRSRSLEDQIQAGD